MPPYERYYTLYIKRFQSKDDLLLSVVLWKKNAFSLMLMEFIIEVSKSGGKMMTTFKDGFLWGGAVAAHQLEGGWQVGG